MAPSHTFTYENPHRGPQPGTVRDPFMLRVDDTYYLTGTLRPIWSGPNPGVPLWSSTDLLTWRSHGLLLARDAVPTDAWYRDRWWAPEIHAADGWFYLTVGCRNETLRRKHGISIWRARAITGPYELLTVDRPFPPAAEQHYPEQPRVEEKYISNDASLATDEAGRHFIFWADTAGILQAEIALPSCAPLSPTRVAVPSAASGWDKNIEGPVVCREGEWFYLFYSGFGHAYDIGVARARTLDGPWETHPRNPLVSPRAPLTHVGHNGVFRGPDGRWWLCYFMQFDGKESLEHLAIDPLDFTADAWPTTPAPSLGRQTVSWPAA